MKNKMHKIFMLTILAAAFNIALSNNVTVTSGSLTGKNTSAGVNNAANYTMVKFTVSWENSWRTSLAPYNSDAAWIFVKYRVGSGPWLHATINTTGYAAPSGSTITPASDGTGAFIYRSADGTGTFTATNAQLRWNYGANGVTLFRARHSCEHFMRSGMNAYVALWTRRTMFLSWVREQVFCSNFFPG